MKAAFVATWSVPVPGREKKAIEFFRELNEYFGKLATEGKISEPEWLFAPGARRIWFIKGEYETLVGLLAIPKVQEFIFTSSFVTEDFEYVITPLGTDEYLDGYEKAGVKLGYI
jgi:hypothetical protein